MPSCDHYGEKRCSRCEKTKPFSDFRHSAHNRSGDGHRSMCKDCARRQDRGDLPSAAESAAAAEEVMPHLFDSIAYEVNQEAVEASVDMKPSGPPPGYRWDDPRPVPEPPQTDYEPEPQPSRNPTGAPQYLRDADVPERVRVLQQLRDMSWMDQQEETRYARIYTRAGSPNQIPGSRPE
jgi:hypothetical protein